MAGTDRRMKDAAMVQAEIVLVKPQMGENIGASARAMLNFGLGNMRIVDPRDGWPNEAATAMASRADEVLQHAALFDSVRDAVSDTHLVFATTARTRDMVKPAVTPREAAERGVAAMQQGQRVAFLFGGERSGLDNDAITLADALIHVPANPAFSSLNLAQAVLLTCYEWRLAAGVGGIGKDDPMNGELPAQHQMVGNLLDLLEESLDEVEMFAKIPEKRESMLRNVRNIFQRASITEQEVSTMFGIVRALTGKRQRTTDPKP